MDVQPAGGDTWEKAKPNRPVFEGDVLRTAAKSRAEITLQGGGKVRIGENSELELTLASVKPMAKNFNANLKKGMCLFLLKRPSVKKERPAANPDCRGSYPGNQIPCICR